MLGAVSNLLRQRPLVSVIATLVVLIAVYPFVARLVFGTRVKPSTLAAIAFQETSSEMPAVPFDDEDAVVDGLESMIAAEKARRERASDTVSGGAARNEPGRGAGGDVRAAWPDAVRQAFEYIRLASEGDPEAYREWLEATGRRLYSTPPEHPFYTPEYYRDILTHFAEEGLGTRVDMDDFFDQYYAGFWRLYDGAYRPESLVSDPRSLEVDVQRITHWSETVQYLWRSDGLGPGFWKGLVYPAMRLSAPAYAFVEDGSGGLSGPSLESRYEAKRLLFEPLFDGRSSVRVCRVNLIYRSETELNIPLAIEFVEGTDGEWMLIAVSLFHVGRDLVRSHPYFAPIPH